MRSVRRASGLVLVGDPETGPQIQPHGSERPVARTVQRRPGVAEGRPNRVTWARREGPGTRSWMSCNSNSRMEIEVVG